MYRTLGNIEQVILRFVYELSRPYRSPPNQRVPAGSHKPFPPTPLKDIEEIVDRLHDKCQTWIEVPSHERAKILRACIETVLEVAEETASISTRMKGSEGLGVGEELLLFVPLVVGLTEYAYSLERGMQQDGQHVHQRPDGQYIADVWPFGLSALVYGGMRAELWIEPGKKPTAGGLYKHKVESMLDEAEKGKKHAIGLVLGAGNHGLVLAMDILHVLIVENRTVCCKMHPVNEYLGPYFRRALSPLVERGFLEFVYGGADVGKLLCNHSAVSLVHLTGSPATYDAIVWDGKTKQETPPYTKTVSAELGCVTPYIIVPGNWSADEITYHAKTVASGLVMNAGHNCLAAEVLLTDATWPQREDFLNALRQQLKKIPPRVAYYPGSSHRAALFKEKFPDAEEIGGKTEKTKDNGLVAAPSSFEEEEYDARRLPWMLKTGLKADEASTKEEFWCGVLQEVALPGQDGDPDSFLSQAVDFANTRLWGTLSCALITHPKTQRKHRKKFEESIANLKYGTITVNVPTSVGYGITALPWGGFPGTSTIYDVGSGNAQVHNTLMYDYPQKGVLYGPWIFYPYPLWFPDHASLEDTSRLLLQWHAHPSILGTLPILRHALLG